ncbi:hypothetical protein F2Q68_00042523 [Brassica cretica]|uniref:Uncharacterized protein n=1 Tax=Brassica cretica TaxID=69181 RepID=A0A8S9MPI8_BRACR|nr:hypothetical protein F2Q68_00042523 [Brassica cretica]
MAPFDLRDDLSTSWSCSQPSPSLESSLVVSLLRRSGLAVVVDEIRREDRSSNINGEIRSRFDSSDRPPVWFTDGWRGGEVTEEGMTELDEPPI